MGKVIDIFCALDDWKSVFELDADTCGTDLSVFFNGRNGSIDIVQQDSNGDTITSHLKLTDAMMFIESLQRALNSR